MWRAFLALCAALVLATPLHANEFLRSSHILGIYQGSDMSGIAEGMRNYPDFDLRDEGSGRIVVRDWYQTDWTDVVVDMLTELDDDLALLWSFSTGERGEKYRIDPSIKLGFIAQHEVSDTSFLTLIATSTMFGNFTELPCEADYGKIGGGVQPVNCRLAATPLPPEETLDYLVNANPTRFSIQLSFRSTF